MKLDPRTEAKVTKLRARAIARGQAHVVMTRSQYRAWKRRYNEADPEGQRAMLDELTAGERREREAVARLNASRPSSTNPYAGAAGIERIHDEQRERKAQQEADFERARQAKAAEDAEYEASMSRSRDQRSTGAAGDQLRSIDTKVSKLTKAQKGGGEQK